MLTYSSATLRRLKDSMSELHDHFWRENYKFPQFLSQNSQEPPNWLLQSGWKTAGWRGNGIEQLPDFARFHKIGAIDRHRRTDMKHMHRYSKAFCVFIAILFPFIYLWMFLCTNVDRSIEPHVCKYQYSHVQALFVFVYSNVEVSCLRMCLRFPCAWFMSFFVKLLPLPLVKRFWDLLVLEGGDVLVMLCAPGIARESFGGNQHTI